MNRFINERKGNWKKLEDLLLKTEGIKGLRGLPRAEVRELGELYRRAAADLAIARAETNDPKLINYLNSLVTRAHGKIYRAESNGLTLVWRFFSREFPGAFRNNWKFVALAAFFELAFMAVGMALIFNDIGFADVLGIDDIRIAAENNQRWWLSLNQANQTGAAFLFTHNIRVSLMAFALGAFFCVGSLLILALNGLDFGASVAICYRVNPDFGNALMTFVVGHGVIETFCIYLAGGAGMMIGYAMINPGDLSRIDALKRRGLESVRIVIGAAAVLIVAGLIEGFLSPSNLPPWIKIATGVSTFTALMAYLTLAGRKTDSNKDSEVPTVKSGHTAAVP
ncbi:MAG: stage II sporulation protein M [Acidobacteriota bacterium]|nr:stage II sporulation protein M [Acidobacteriota bacterium]